MEELWNLPKESKNNAYLNQQCLSKIIVEEIVTSWHDEKDISILQDNTLLALHRKDIPLQRNLTINVSIGEVMYCNRRLDCLHCL